MISLLDDFNLKFKEYCMRTYTKTGSGAAGSYSNVIKYLFEYLEIEKVEDQTILEIRSLEPDLLDKTNPLYNKLRDFFAARGQSSYLEKGFLKAALPILYSFWNKQDDFVKEEIVLLKELKDSQVEATFRVEKLKGQFPTQSLVEHIYNLRKINGTTNEAVKHIRSGRKAEKYFISFLADHLGFLENEDFFDMANNKNFGYDVRFRNVGLEIKNIKSGGFYLTDNEIARLEATSTHLILVDIDNGIWLLKNNSAWLKRIIDDIKSIRNYCKLKYTSLDLSDIKINLDENAQNDVYNLTRLDREEILFTLI